MDTSYHDLEGEDIYSHNAEAAGDITNAIRSTLGPMGMDKMLVDGNGVVTVTNTGVRILQELAIEEPIG
ncbi:MAG: TCP-1/cpn60 chaperonin family protein, partial [Halobacteriota archaeon]